MAKVKFTGEQIESILNLLNSSELYEIFFPKNQNDLSDEEIMTMRRISNKKTVDELDEEEFIMHARHMKKMEENEADKRCALRTKIDTTKQLAKLITNEDLEYIQAEKEVLSNMPVFCKLFS